MKVLKNFKKTKLLFLSVILSLCLWGAFSSTIALTGCNTQDNNAAQQKINYYDKANKATTELSDAKYQDGTYNIDNYEPLNYKNGYQVSFCQKGDNYSADEYNALVEKFLKESSDNIVAAGKFDGTPEISFNISDKDKAIKLANEYNQISIWDWSTNDEIRTDGTGVK